MSPNLLFIFFENQFVFNSPNLLFASFGLLCDVRKSVMDLIIFDDILVVSVIIMGPIL